MLKSRRVSGLRVIAGGSALLLVLAIWAIGDKSVTSTSWAQEGGEVAEPAPPADQTYTGVKRCSSCHFQQFMSWKKTKHADAFKLLTAAYQSNAKCLECHTTGYGEPTGFKDAASGANLAGVTCETCHGPGSKHEEISQPYAKTKEVPPEAEKAMRDSIWRILPQNICLDCHTVQGHGESQTPPELQTKD